MKKFYYISIIASMMVVFSLANYLNAQEYDDLYYSPKKDKEKEATEEANYEKSDYEKYLEALEKEANQKSDSISANNKIETEKEYSEDLDYVGSENLNEQKKASKNSEKEYYDDYYNDYESRFRRSNSCCYTCGYWDVMYVDPYPSWGLSFSFGYPYSSWGIYYGYPSYYRYYSYNLSLIPIINIIMSSTIHVNIDSI